MLMTVQSLASFRRDHHIFTDCTLDPMDVQHGYDHLDVEFHAPCALVVEQTSVTKRKEKH